jgi:hypothetical protein
MERVELKEISQNWIDGLIKDKEFIAAVDRYSSALIAAKPIVMRGCDLKGKGSMVALSLTYANAGYTGEFTLDAEFVKALLKEYTDVALPKYNLI